MQNYACKMICRHSFFSAFFRNFSWNFTCSLLRVVNCCQRSQFLADIWIRSTDNLKFGGIWNFKAKFSNISQAIFYARLRNAHMALLYHVACRLLGQEHFSMIGEMYGYVFMRPCEDFAQAGEIVILPVSHIHFLRSLSIYPVPDPWPCPDPLDPFSCPGPLDLVPVPHPSL